MRILIAEDEKDMQKIIQMYLEKEGYETVCAANGKEAFDRLCESDFDLAIVDWMMPCMDGVALCREIRKHQIPVKVIMLTAKDKIEDEIAGLQGGVDDYIRKPFEPKILLLRIRKLFQMDQMLFCGAISLNYETWIAKKGDEEIKLSKKEFELLQTFLRNQGIVLSREKLLNLVWGFAYEGDERTVDTHVRRLRNKIGEDYIRTHVGMGYSMAAIHE